MSLVRAGIGAEEVRRTIRSFGGAATSTPVWAVQQPGRLDVLKMLFPYASFPANGYTSPEEGVNGGAMKPGGIAALLKIRIAEPSATISGLGSATATVSGVGSITGGGFLTSQRLGTALGAGSATLAAAGYGNVTALVRIGASPSAFDIGSEIFDVQIMDNGLTLREAMRLLLAAAAGDIVDLGSGSRRVKAAGGTQTRIEADVDAANRDVTLLDVSV